VRRIDHVNQNNFKTDHFLRRGRRGEEEAGKVEGLAGLVPVCFADADARKRHTKFAAPGGGGYDILPLGEATEQYPEYMPYLTLGHEKFDGASEALIKQGIPKERIKYADPVEYRKGCWSLGKFMVLSAENIYTCCTPHRNAVCLSENIQENFENYKKICSDIINRIREGKDTPCDDCILAYY
jgi:hypothetical protein